MESMNGLIFIYIIIIWGVMGILSQKYYELKSKVKKYEELLKIKEREKEYIPTAAQLMEVYNDKVGLRKFVRVITNYLNKRVDIKLSTSGKPIRLWLLNKLKIKGEV